MWTKISNDIFENISTGKTLRVTFSIKGVRTVQKKVTIKGWLHLSEQKEGTCSPRFYASKSIEVKIKFEFTF